VVGANDKFFIDGDAVTVEDFETGEVVDRPNIAGRGLGLMTEAVEKAGGGVQGPIRLIGPEEGPSLRLVRTEEET